MNPPDFLRPWGPVPSTRQLAWHRLELYGFLHFTVNTFTDKEWGYGDESPDLFHPTAFDADQLVESAADGGLRGLILTCKHHDGFCLWPTATTPHSVRRSSWRNGAGDVVRAVSDACARRGLRFGVYLSPWDRNHPAYGTAAYPPLYRNQLRELLSGYGPIFEIWFDGANGGDGYYGGAREKRAIDPRTYYGWEENWNLARELQPDACLSSDAGPDVRWVGNEGGIAGDPCWNAIQGARFSPGLADCAILNRGERDGDTWRPAECDVSIRPGWFYHPAEDDRVRSPENLLDLYFQSVGRGASLLLNLPPDRRGLIPETDRASLREFRRRLDALTSRDLVLESVLEGAAALRDPRFGPDRLRDGRPDTFWCPGDAAPAEVLLTFPRPVRPAVADLGEYLPLGQRIDALALDTWTGSDFRQVASAEGVGHRRLIRLEPTETTRLRLRITRARACPALTRLALYPGVP